MTEKDHMDNRPPERPQGPLDLPPRAGGAAETPAGVGISSEANARSSQRMQPPRTGVGGGPGGPGSGDGPSAAELMGGFGLGTGASTQGLEGGQEATMGLGMTKEETENINRMQAEKTAAALILQNPGSNDAQIAHAISVMGAPRDQARAMLKNLGHDDTRIEDIMSNYGIGMPEALTEEEKGQIDSEDSTRETVRNFEEDPIAVKLREMEDRMKDPKSEPTDADLADIERARGKIRHFFFDEADGVFRREERVRRLLIKPGVSSLFALGITYLCLLSFATKWATKRVGSG
ncbi:MAG TPA: hypothetical protein VLG67_04425 [Candidatus Saccharimonadales bacterium]|nr:hypothetical protein [Candidatus Saccharimonadales bacterium]